LGTSDRAIGTFETPVGPITVSSDGRSVVGLEWRSSPADAAGGEPDRDHAAGARDLDRGRATDGRMDPVLVEAIAQLRAYFDGRLGDFDLPVAFGPISDVAKAVLTTLSETVEAGTTVTYGDLAEASGTGIPARAVGGIMGLNPIPIIVPCHRVISGDSLGGYSGGLPGHELETKRRLLEWENALPQPLF
jgi:methylated-DNA-[protein]-cysteine S-methyltransferase